MEIFYLTVECVRYYYSAIQGLCNFRDGLDMQPPQHKLPDTLGHLVFWVSPSRSSGWGCSQNYQMVKMLLFLPCPLSLTGHGHGAMHLQRNWLPNKTDKNQCICKTLQRCAYKLDIIHYGRIDMKHCRAGISTLTQKQN